MEKTKHLDNIANKYHQTKDPKYKKLWYDLIKEFSNGHNNIKRRTVSPDSNYNKDFGWNSVDKRR